MANKFALGCALTGLMQAVPKPVARRQISHIVPRFGPEPLVVMAAVALLQGDARVSQPSVCRPAFAQAGLPARARRARYQAWRPAVEQPRQGTGYPAGRRAGRDRDQRRGGLQDHAARARRKRRPRSRRTPSAAAARAAAKPKPPVAGTAAPPSRKAASEAQRRARSRHAGAVADRANPRAAANAAPRRRRTRARSWASCAAPPRPCSGFRNGPRGRWRAGSPRMRRRPGRRPRCRLPGFEVVASAGGR